MRIEQRLELLDVFLRLCDRRRGYRVSGHGYRELVARRVLAYQQTLVTWHASHEKGGTYDAGKDLFESVGCTGCFGLTTIERVFEFKEGLADGVGERDAGRVDKRDRADPPSLK